MTQIDRILRDIVHDPWTSRIFLAFTVGMFLSCSAEFAAGQPVTGAATGLQGQVADQPAAWPAR